MARAKKRRKVHGPQFRAEAVAEALAGNPPDVARKRGVTLRTLQRWIKESKTSPDMSRDVARKSALIEQDWAETAKAAMRSMLADLVATIRKATSEKGTVPKDRIHEIAGAVKVVGELGVAKEMFGRGRPNEDNREDAAPTEGAAVVPIRGVKGVRAAE